MKSIPRRCGALVGALAILAGAQAPTTADVYRHRDARHDVEAFPGQHRAFHNREADVTHVRIGYDDQALVFRVRLRSTSLKHVEFRGLGFRLKTPGHSYAGNFLDHGHEVQYLLFDETTGRDFTCDESSGTRGHVVWLRLDPSCFKNPRWIRAAITVGTDTHHNRVKEDNALSNKWHSKDNTFSPRIPATE